MALSSTLNKKVFTASAAQTAFAFGDVLYFDQTHLKVYVDGVLKTLSTHYTVSPTTNTPNGTPGGTVTFLTPMVGGEQVVILRVVPVVQGVDYQENEKFPANTHEKGLDWLTMIDQQHEEQLYRQLQLPQDETGTSVKITLPSVANRTNRFMAWDGSGNPIAATAVTGAPVTPYMETVLDDTTAAAARATLGVNSATTSAEGLVELATSGETKAMADATRAVTPSTLLGLLPTTGDVKLTFKAAADATWVMMNDGSIGSASSGATTRANADTEPLYTLLWGNVIDQWAPVVGGRGANAAADYAANKAMYLPRTLGRALAGCGTGVVAYQGSDGGVDLTSNTFAVPANSAFWITGMPVLFTLTSGTITGLTSGVTYYIVRPNNTQVHLASTRANAQNGTIIDLTAKSSPVWTISHTYTTRVLGEAVGETDHAMSLTEMLSHAHTADHQTSGARAGSAGSEILMSAGDTGFQGGNDAFNIMQPTVFLNVMVKL